MILIIVEKIINNEKNNPEDEAPEFSKRQQIVTVIRERMIPVNKAALNKTLSNTSK